MLQQTFNETARQTIQPLNQRDDRSFFKGQNHLEGEAPVAEEVAPLLTTAEIQQAIVYMRTSYARQSIRLLRQRFELPDGDNVDRELVLAIAHYQDVTDGLTVDGKLGPTSFDALQAEGGEAVQDAVFFRVTSPLGGRMTMDQGGGLTSMVGHFFVEVRLPPGEDCGDYVYRQYICGRVQMLGATANPIGPMTNLATLYSNIPGGQLPAIPNYREDGDTSIPSQYGHRELPARAENRYLNADGSVNQRSGCIFKSFDRPGIIDRRCQTGEQYEFDFRFRGEVRHKDRGVIAVRYWNATADFVIP